MTPRPSKWVVFGIVAVGVLMATIDSSIVNVSLPVIARGFGVPLGGEVEWVVIAYLVVVASLLLTVGRISDVVGRRRVWATGLAAFTAASALCGAAPSLGALVGFRAMQGVGSAGTMAVSPAMLVAAFPPEQRGRALGLNAVVVGLGISLGPTLGGVITEHFGWRWIFYVNVPLGILGVVASLRVLPHETAETRQRVDWVGAMLLAAGLGGLTAGLSFGPELGWTSAPLLVCGVLAIAGIAGLFARVLLADQPLVDPRLWQNRVFASASVSLLLAFIATFAVAVFMPFYLVQLRGFSAQKAGLLLTPLPLTIALVSPVTGSLADRMGTQKLAAGGMFLAAVGLAWLSFLDVDASIPRIVVNLLLIGVGQAAFQPPNNSALMGAAPRERQGVAAGVLATGRTLGQSLSVAFAGALFGLFGGAAAARALHRGAGAGPSADAFLHGMNAALLGCALVALTSSAVALVRGKDLGGAAGGRSGVAESRRGG
ncbi:MAG TPA: DHA2 family efflux MFS transporter permease subunit [Polyangiaceae bacterium]|nr:DHA2 family efflux MFS transporter permease subunit [Polyangiaceae bacterium]